MRSAFKRPRIVIPRSSLSSKKAKSKYSAYYKPNFSSNEVQKLIFINFKKYFKSNYI